MKFYDALLWLYPASFRAQYGGEMRAIFGRQFRQASGLPARAMLLLDALVDALRHAPAAHGDVTRQDVTAAWQSVRRAPAFAVVVVLVTALGIGATTTAFTIADHVLIRPLPFRDSDRLVKLWQLTPGGGWLEASPGNFRDWRAHATSFESMAAFSVAAANLVGVGPAERLEGAWVSGDLFTLLGASPLIGRAIAQEDDRDNSAPTVVISERLWRARFASESTVLGRAVNLNGAPVVVVGVMPRTFEFPGRGLDFWMPYRFTPANYEYGTHNPYLQVVGRLKNGVSREQALGEMQGIARAVARAVPAQNARIGVDVVYLRDEIAPQARLLLWGPLAAAAGLLLIACTNIANMLLTRGLARHRELAVRAALGAGRHRLMRQMLTEAALLAGAGGLAGVAIAAIAIPAVAQPVPAGLPIAEVPPLDIRLLAAATAATAATAIGFGVTPAIRLARQTDAGALRDGGRTGTPGSTARLRAALVVAQVSASLVLLISSRLLLRAMLRVQSADPGFTSDGVLTLRTALPTPRYASEVRRHEFFSRVLEGVQALPGVSHAAYITGLPMVLREFVWVLGVPDRPELPPEQRTASLRFITPGFFDALGIPIYEGRDVSDGDTQASPLVAVVSRSLATRHWPGEEPIGRRFTVQGRERVVVGLVGDIRVRGLEQDSEPQVYLPARQMNDPAPIVHIPKDLVVRSSLAPAALLPAIRTIVARADPDQPVSDVQPLEDILRGETVPRRMQLRVLGTFTLIAFLLAGIGLHGLLAFNVSQGAREIGIRIALGARRLTILAMVLQRAMTLTAAGVGAGCALAVMAGRSLQALLAEISPMDTATYAAAVGLAGLIGVAGALPAALRAVQVDPVEAMRSE